VGSPLLLVSSFFFCATMHGQNFSETAHTNGVILILCVSNVGELNDLRFQFSSWATKKNDFHKKFNKNTPVPMRVMFGTILRETEKCYYVELYGKPEPTTHCLHCLRKLTHNVSMYYGLGPVCGKHYYISGITEANLEEHFDEIRKKMKLIQWSGLVPKGKVTLEYENLYVIEFIYSYRTKTSDITKVKEIRAKSTKVVSETSTQI
jgi:hypothetical protein